MTTWTMGTAFTVCVEPLPEATVLLSPRSTQRRFAGLLRRSPTSAQMYHHFFMSRTRGDDAFVLIDRGGQIPFHCDQEYTMDLLSIPDYYIKKGRPQGHRYGKKPGDKEYYIAHQLKKKCKKKYYQGIHDRFVRDDKFRRNMIEIGRTEDLCRQMDDLADEDHTQHLTPTGKLGNWETGKLRN